MTFFEWKQSMSVGVSLVDDDHKLLISLINQLHDSLDDREEHSVLASVLNTLVDYTVYHFRREEKVMEAAGYGDLESHRGQHEALTRRVLEVVRRHRDNPDDMLGNEVLEFLKEWLIHHIMRDDMAYRGVVVGNDAAVAAATQVPRIQPEPDSDTPAATAEEDPRLDWTVIKVLIVDDNVNFRRVTRTILESVKVRQIEEAENGAEALEVLHDFRPDVVLCDWRMDEMDGIEFVRMLRDNATARHHHGLPVIMMTGFGDEAFRERALSAGISDFLEKPITARGVLLSVARAVANG